MEHFSLWERRIDVRRRKGSIPQNELSILFVLQKICYGHDLISMLIYRLCNCFILHTACMSPSFKTPRYWLRGVRHMHHQKLHSVNPCPVSSCWSMLWILLCLHFFPSSVPPPSFWCSPCSLSPLPEVRRENVKFKWVENGF